MSPQMLQHMMRLFVADLEAAGDGRLDLQRVRQLAGLGGGGRFPQNMNKQLVDSLSKTNMPKQISFLVPMRHTVHGFFYRACDMILPHALFSALYHHYHAEWIRRVCPSQEAVARFWSSVQHGVQFLNHPVRHLANFRSHCIPIVVHGDGTPVVGIGKAWGRLMDIWSWSSMLVLTIL